ncbi:MAG: haloacid dehalogenase, partial [Microbacteriaceae bacterium]|nr:haloacid dehalogenase [Microbacteriaceae bacterium]
MNPTWTCILFDLDGTIVDSAPGITASLAWTYAQLGRPIPTPSELLTFVGPPILDAFKNHSGMT